MLPVMRSAPRWLLSIALVTSSGCASSPYDRGWVDDSVQRATGHAPGPTQPAPSLPPGLRADAPLTEDDAVAIALWNSPRFQVELARLGFSRADLAEAGALPNPTLAFLLPIGPRQVELSATYPVGALIQRPTRVAAAKLDVERTARALVEVALDLVRDVRLAHAEVILARRRLLVRGELERLGASTTELALARLRGGDASELEARTARADALLAMDATVRARLDVTLATERLRRLLGLAVGPLGARLDVRGIPVVAGPPRPVSELVSIALAARPDVRAAELGVHAAGERLGWEKAKILQLLARVDVKPVGSQGGAPLLVIPGGQIDIPIFNWNPGGRGRAEAEMQQAAARYAATTGDVATAVRLAHAELEQAMASLAPLRESLLPLLEANVASATRAYERGAETYLVALDATRREQEAKLREVDLEGDVLRARASLDRAVGRKLP